MKHPLLPILFALLPGLLSCSPGGPRSHVHQHWERHIIDNSSVGADGVRFADFDDDGYTDIVTGWEEGGLVRFYRNPGTSNARAPWPLVTLGKAVSVEDAVPVDVDGDGTNEVLASCEGDEKAHYLYRAPTNSTASWSREVVPATLNVTRWMYATPLDSMHIVVGGKDDGASIGLLHTFGSPSVSSWQYEPLARVGWMMSIRSFDMDADGDNDILYTDRRGAERGVWWLENPGMEDGDWVRHHVGINDREVMFLDISDLDGDGLSDIVAAIHETGIVGLRRLDAGGLNWSHVDIDIPDFAGRIGKGIAAGDIDANGSVDLVYSTENAEGKAGLVYLSPTGSPWTDRWNVFDLSGPEGVKFDQVLLRDIDADGDLDVATCEEVENLGVIWFENPQFSP